MGGIMKKIIALVLSLCFLYGIHGGVQAGDTEKEVYKIAYLDGHVPFTYTDKQGQAQGIAVSVMNEIGRILNIEFKYIEMEEITGRVDINLSIYSQSQLSYTDRISEPYFNLPMMMIGDINHQNNDNIRIGGADYYGVDNQDIKELYPSAQVDFYKDINEARDLYEIGVLDYILVSNVIANEVGQWVENEEITLIPMNKNLPGTLAFGNHLPQKFVDQVNQVIMDLDEGVVDGFILRAVKQAEGDIDIYDLWQEYREFILIAVLCVILSFVLIALYTAFEKKRKLLEYLNYDIVTGLNTEKYFMEQLHKILKNKQKLYAVISIDIDNYKYINSTYGYDTGTKTLIDFAQFIQSIEEVEHASRVFADQYLLLIKEKNVKKVLTLLETDEEITHKFTSRLGDGYNLSLSIGVYVIKGDESLPTDIIDAANAARGASKKAYGRISTMYSYEMEKEMEDRNRVVQNMQKAIYDQEFYLLYQPKVNLSNGEIIGAEALVRWECNGYYIYPDQCISIFEDNGFIRILDSYVFEKVCKLISEHPQVPQIAVNLSGVTLLENDTINKFMTILNEYQVKPERIQIEVTESAIIIENKKAIEQISKLKEKGFCIALDDFGAGESSLNRLKDFHIDVLKLDKEFLGTTLLNTKGVYIIEYVIKLAKKLNIKVVAEGVETVEQSNVLKELGCDIGQGYLFAKPLAQDIFLERIK